MSGGSKETHTVDPTTRNAGLGILGQAQNYASTPFHAFDPNSISGFESPSTNDVINAGVSDLNKTRQMGILGNGDNATFAHAFGGSRQGVADSLTNSDFLKTVSDYIANTRNTGYNNASNLALTNWQASNADPANKLGILSSVFGSTTLPTATTTGKTTTNPGLTGILSSLGDLLAGAGKAGLSLGGG